MKLREKILSFIAKTALKVLEMISLENYLKESSQEEKVKLIATDETEKASKKFFGKDSLFDKINEIELEIFHLKKYSLEDYERFKKRLDELTKESKDFYEDNETTDIYAMKIMSSHYDLEIYQKLYKLLEEVKSFKKEKVNYELGMQTLKQFKEYLSTVHLKLVANNSDICLLEKVHKGLNCKLEEVSDLEFEENTIRQEEMCKAMCECIYIFFKCNSLCGNIRDISDFKEIFLKEKNVFWGIFIENVTDLLNKAQSFKSTKYYRRYECYLRAILDKSNVSYEVLLNEKFFKEFVSNEKKIIELHYFYTVNGNTSRTNTTAIGN